MKKILELFDFANKKFEKRGIDTSIKQNRQLVYDIILETYGVSAACSVEGINPLVDLGKEYVEKGKDFLKTAKKHR